MKITVLAASGATGQELTRQALARDHEVTAISRRPRSEMFDARVRQVAGDVNDAQSIARALEGSETVVSGLGISGKEVGALSAGARAVIASGAKKIVWLGAFGTGASASTASAFTQGLLKLVLGSQIPDKVNADSLILAAGGTVFHAGPLSNGALSETRQTLRLEEVKWRFFPARVSRATVAAAMLDAAEGGLSGVTLVSID